MSTSNKVRIGFEKKAIELPLASILPIRQVKPTDGCFGKYRTVLASIRAIGLVEPLVVYPNRMTKGTYLLLDGHMRLKALQEIGTETVLCLVSTDASLKQASAAAECCLLGTIRCDEVLSGTPSRTPAARGTAPTPPASPTGAMPAANLGAGAARFWADCVFQPVTPNAGYEIHRISLATLSDEARDALAATMEHHYLEPAAFRSGIGGDVLARVLEARLPSRVDSPTAKKDRAGDLGELLGIEWLRRHSRGIWEVCCTLRWKESIRPRRGEDIVAVRWDVRPVGLLKGEAKAAESIGGATIAEARSRLDQDGGWPAPFTIDFLAEKLSKDGREDEAARLFDERFKVTPRPTDRGCTHLLFLFSGDDPNAHVATHGMPAAGIVHGQIAAILVCPGYAAIRDGVHNRAVELARTKPAP
jgi:hypothetical protein